MEQLRNWRKARGLSTDDAGQLIGVSNVQWSRIETGSRKVAAEKVLELERITGISRHELRPDVFGPATAEAPSESPAAEKDPPSLDCTSGAAMTGSASSSSRSPSEEAA